MEKNSERKHSSNTGITNKQSDREREYMNNNTYSNNFNKYGTITEINQTQIPTQTNYSNNTGNVNNTYIKNLPKPNSNNTGVKYNNNSFSNNSNTNTNINEQPNSSYSYTGNKNSSYGYTISNNTYDPSYNKTVINENEILKEENLNLKRQLEREKAKSYHLEEEINRSHINVVNTSEIENLKEYFYL
jgi:hypothetical protein